MLNKLATNRRAAVLAGLLLVLVPTLFSLFPEWQDWAVGVRVAVLLVWVGSAVLVVTATTRQSEQVEDLVGEPSDHREVQREAAGRRLIRALLGGRPTTMPDSYEFRLFLPNEEGTLMPSFESSEGIEPSEGWAPGRGATGTAWERNSYVVVAGENVSDATYGLTPEQQQRYRSLQVVASAPVQNARGRAIGVLSVSSINDDGRLRSPEGLAEHVELAQVVARILIDIVQLDSD